MAKLTSNDVSESLRVITLADRLDIQGTEKVEGTLASLAQGRNVVVNLVEVTFLSSVGIRALVASGKALKAAGKKMVLVVGDNAAAERTLKTTCTDALLPVFKNQDDALAALAS